MAVAASVFILPAVTCASPGCDRGMCEYRGWRPPLGGMDSSMALAHRWAHRCRERGRDRQGGHAGKTAYKLVSGSAEQPQSFPVSKQGRGYVRLGRYTSGFGSRSGWKCMMWPAVHELVRDQACIACKHRRFSLYVGMFTCFPVPPLPSCLLPCPWQRECTPSAHT